MSIEPSEIRIVIADDHPIFRKGLRQIIEMEPGLRVVAEASDGSEALTRITEQRPAVVVLDVDMPVMDGFEVVRAIRSQNLPVEIIFLTMHKDEDVFNEALNVSVRGYVVKDSAVTDIVGGIRAVAAGQSFISPSISGYLLNRTARVTPLGILDLTLHEKRILLLIADHLTNKEIATQLFVSHRTVENHRSNICNKLNLRGSHALLKFALDRKVQLYKETVGR
jgi:DNA-binding NarL/FixJ family response regulator